jgi:hypothetical protein
MSLEEAKALIRRTAGRLLIRASLSVRKQLQWHGPHDAVDGKHSKCAVRMHGSPLASFDGGSCSEVRRSPPAALPRPSVRNSLDDLCTFKYTSDVLNVPFFARRIRLLACDWHGFRFGFGPAGPAPSI